ACGAETRWGGGRAAASLDGTRTRLVSRNDIDVSRSYPELAGLAEAAGVPAIVDGEIVGLGTAGRISFEALQPRMHLQNAAQVRRMAEQSPVTFCVFD